MIFERSMECARLTILLANVLFPTSALKIPPRCARPPLLKGAFRSPPLTKEGQGGFRQQGRLTPAPQDKQTVWAKAPRCRKGGRHLFLLSIFLFQYFSLSSIYAQITLDGSLGPQGALLGPNYTIDANVGKQVGGNLFHSFGEFNVRTAESATFTGPNTVDNIIGRVTGGNPSLIDGTLRSTIPEANLYLVNPSGVLFGPNASLDVGGSFHVSTADYLKLGENGRFEATTLSDSLLTSAPPEAFGFLGSNPAPISIQGSKLAVPEGETLSVIGGNIQILGNEVDGKELSAPSGKINLASIASSGEVILNTPGESASLNVDSFPQLGRIDITQKAFIASSGQAGGSVVIRGGQLLVDHSDIGADTKGNVDGSTTGVDINIRGDAIFTREAFVSTLGHGSGRVGDINIEADNVAIRDGAAFLSRTTGPTDGGAVKITAKDSLAVSGPESLVGTLTTEQGRNGGDIVLSAAELTVEEGGAIQTATDVLTRNQGAGNAGDVVVKADRVTLRDGGSRLSSITDGVGQGGDIIVSANESILVTGQTRQNAASIATLTKSSGNAGHIQIATPDLRLEGGFMSVAAAGAGRAGNIEIDTARASLTDGAIIDSSTIGSGQGGEIVLNATESIRLSGFSVDNEPNLISSVAFGSGDAGRIRLTTPDLTVGQGSITALSTGAGEAGNIELQVNNASFSGTGAVVGVNMNQDAGQIDSSSSGTGRGGNIKITADNAFVVAGDGSGVFSDTGGSGAGGAIDLHAKDIQLTDGATISSKSIATGDAGNVTITATDTFRSENSRVTTEAETADGGDITVTVGSLASLSHSQIIASAQQGEAGNITIDPATLVLNRSSIFSIGGSGGVIRILPGVFVASSDSLTNASASVDIQNIAKERLDPSARSSDSFYLGSAELLPVRCAARLRDGRASSFVVRGRDALPPTPDGVLPSPILRRDKTSSGGSNAALVRGWDKAGLAQVGVEVDCLK
jgi:filamentous hemagglutinin family protein